MTDYDKLVRDRIPEIIDANDERPITHVAADSEYEQRLGEKLLEEAQEFTESAEIEELADVLEVVDAILEYEGLSSEQLETIQRDKRERRGGFTDRVVLERVEDGETGGDDSEGESESESEA